MKESGQAAFSYIKAHADKLGIPLDAFRYWDVHVHVPAGAIPKDGPSAGTALFAALASIYTQRRVRGDVAMTGEITLRGLILPVGGIKEKVLAAKRGGIDTVILPEKNEKDVSEISDRAIEGLDVRYISRINELLDLALDEEQVNDPKERFALSEQEKRLLAGLPPDNGHVQKPTAEGETVME
jgi:ATP-dependent Lon protease